MPTDQVEPVEWRISPNDRAHALQVLQDADEVRDRRLRVVNGAHLDRWPGYELRIYIEDASRLYADQERSEAMEKIVKRILRDGVRTRLRLVIQW